MQRSIEIYHTLTLHYKFNDPWIEWHFSRRWNRSWKMSPTWRQMVRRVDDSSAETMRTGWLLTVSEKFTQSRLVKYETNAVISVEWERPLWPDWCRQRGAVTLGYFELLISITIREYRRGRIETVGPSWIGSGFLFRFCVGGLLHVLYLLAGLCHWC